ncbi:alpha/beta hydrolase [Xinfangfangia sp. CPCC 101601]|uniref:Alpha/beta hydrolase n=1 Tax=Pseudogemmobacter lacusdianii TaxID=3069608 RepID=A0ABU0VTE5_9RHOB|nr:alpha/beta hydrolase [Xinfangfangia sp. CPCC 101601]MDQ2064983.1 alpha/beta hydrolase [Xinfangfangia sp. CPCC 101601]
MSLNAALQPAPFDLARADGPTEGHAVWLWTADGVRIRAAVWAGGKKGTVVLLPGRTEYVEKYGRAAADLLARGYSVVSLDWRGQGLAARALADPMKGHVVDFDEYQRDLDALLGLVAKEGLPQPLMLLSHSMGGCIALRALHRDLGFKASVFSAPMWGIVIPWYKRLTARLLVRYADELRMTERFVPSTSRKSNVLDVAFTGNPLTNDAQMWDYMVAQLREEPKLGLGGPSVAWLRAALRECAALMSMPAPNVPALTCVGARERVVKPMPIYQRMDDWPKGELEVYPSALHEIMMEGPELRKAFFDSAVSLFDKHR